MLTWIKVNFVTGEFINPARDLPRVIHTSLPSVILAYLLANTAYFLVLPLPVTFSSTTIAVQFGAQVFGRIGSLVLALIVSGSCFGALNATTFTTSRLFYAAAKEGYLPSLIGTLGYKGEKVARAPSRLTSGKESVIKKLFFSVCADDMGVFATPIPSLALSLVLTTVYIVLGTFSTLITFYGVVGYLFYFLTVLGLLVLRVKEPNLERPYRCWITTPIIFCCVSLFLLSRSVVAEPITSVSIVPFLLAGLALYWWKISGSTGRGRQRAERSDWRFWKRRGRI